MASLDSVCQKFAALSTTLFINNKAGLLAIMVRVFGHRSFGHRISISLLVSQLLSSARYPHTILQCTCQTAYFKIQPLTCNTLSEMRDFYHSFRNVMVGTRLEPTRTLRLASWPMCFLSGPICCFCILRTKILLLIFFN